MKPQRSRRRLSMKWDKAKLGLAILGGTIGLELIVVCVLALATGDVPAEMWDVVRLTVAMLTGAVGSQYLNGKVKDSNSTG